MSAILLTDLRELVAGAKAKAPELSRALEKAATILLLRQVRPVADRLNTYEVESEEEVGKFYLVNGTCSCLSFRRGAVYCKHRLAVILRNRLVEQVDVRERQAREAAQRVEEAAACARTEEEAVRARERQLVAACSSFAKLLGAAGLVGV